MATWSKTKNLELQYADPSTHSGETFAVEALLNGNWEIIDDLDIEGRYNTADSNITTANGNITTANSNVSAAQTTADTAKSNAATAQTAANHNADMIANTKQAIMTWLNMETGVYVYQGTYTAQSSADTYYLTAQKSLGDYHFNPFALFVYGEGLPILTIFRSDLGTDYDNDTVTTTKTQQGGTVTTTWNHLSVNLNLSGASQYNVVGTTYSYIFLCRMDYNYNVKKYLNATKLMS